MSAPILLGLVGKARAGKDTVAKILVEEHGFARVAFADALKEAALVADPWVAHDYDGEPVRLTEIIERDGWEDAKREPEVRHFLQRFGMGMRAALPGCWIGAAMRVVNRHVGAGTSVVVTDVRFPDELDAMRGYGRARTFAARVTRPGAGLDGPAGQHESERLADEAEVDFEIPNDGTLDDLRRFVHLGVIATHVGMPS